MKFQVAGVKVTAVMLGTDANEPEGSVATGVIQLVTAVAVAAELALRVTPPIKPMLPVIKSAWRVCAKVITRAVTILNSVVIFIIIG